MIDWISVPSNLIVALVVVVPLVSIVASYMPADYTYPRYSSVGVSAGAFAWAALILGRHSGLARDEQWSLIFGVFVGTYVALTLLSRSPGKAN